ncbi:24011_t:CDS:2 [Gigaspora margarita]|uniref:24011_t:CDS:1 n=1 Tax=Gigaspora margarita TaxID=4874 RepID=A0ABN7UYZ3_GIGMA|nr:24011_t:CDS:2 [Gigaspora margarita]
MYKLSSESDVDVNIDDSSLKLELYLKFAENGNAAAIYELTNCYAIGTRTDKNYERTFE